MATLSPTRKTDLAKMADELQQLAESYGAEVRIVLEWPASGCHEAMVRIRLEDAEVGIGIDKDCAKHGYVIPWNTAHGGTRRRFSSAFGSAVCAEVNPYHRAKCMGFARTWPSLLVSVDRALRCIVSGEAFERSDDGN